jgi:hypothetical protein
VIEINAAPFSATGQLSGAISPCRNPPSEDVKDIIENEVSLGLTFGVNLFIGDLPDQPDLSLAVYDTGGDPPEPAYTYERPGVEVVVRGNQGGYKAARAMARDIRDLLNGLNEETWGGSRYIGIWAAGDIGFIAFDEIKRPRFSMRFDLHRTVMGSSLVSAGGFVSSGLNPPSEDVKDMLAANSILQLTFADDLFIGLMPDQPDACVAVYDGPGEKAEPSYRYERPHVQVMVRGDQGKYRVAHIRAQTIRDALNGVQEETWGGARYIGVWALGDVISLGLDELRRPRCSINFRLHRTS